MRETEMLQRVVAILTQAREATELATEGEDEDGLSPQALMVGELITESLHVDTVTPASGNPQVVANAVAQALQQRVALLAGCFTMAFTRLATEYDAREPDVTAAEVLRQMVIAWELDDEPS